MLFMGKSTISMGKSPFFMGKSTISMAMFNSKVLVYQRLYMTWVISHGFGQATACATPGVQREEQKGLLVIVGHG